MTTETYTFTTTFDPANETINERKEIFYTKRVTDVDYSSKRSDSQEFFTKIERHFSQDTIDAYFQILLGVPSYKDEVKKFLDDCQNKICEISNLREVDFYAGQIKSILKIINSIAVLPKSFSRIYFINTEKKSVGVTIYGNGTLNIEFEKRDIALYTHAMKSEYGGMLSSDGRIKITKYQKNSQYIKHALDFIR